MQWEGIAHMNLSLFLMLERELFDSAYAKRVLEKLVGEHEQIPPQFSAVSVGGKRAYALAREGCRVCHECKR